MKKCQVIKAMAISVIISLIMPLTVMASGDMEAMTLSETEEETETATEIPVTEDEPEEETESETAKETESAIPETESRESETEKETEKVPDTESRETEAKEPETRETEKKEPETKETEKKEPETKEPRETEESKVPETETEESKEPSDDKEKIDIDDAEKLDEKEDQPTDQIDEAETALSNPEYEKVSSWLRYNTKVPFEGLPDYITQEMIYNALYEADTYGVPASVTIAQIIYDSTENGKFISLADSYCNLFKLKGQGSNGSKSYNGISYAAYNTYSDSMNARAQIISEKKYKNIGKSIKGIEGDNYSKAYAIKFAERWYGSAAEGYKLIKIISQYDLNRIDAYTYQSFSDMMGVFANPCPGSHVTSGFGYRAWSNSQHNGIDMATYGLHIPTYAAEAGTVISVGYGSSVGNMIVIDHGNGMVTKYMHHSQMYVKVGQKVLKGQQIGLAGTTGNSTGIHLHFQLEVNGSATSPVSRLNASGTDKSINCDRKESGIFATSQKELTEIDDFGKTLGINADTSFNEMPSTKVFADPENKRKYFEKLDQKIIKVLNNSITLIEED